MIHAKTIPVHNARLVQVLLRIQEAGLTLHKEKCEFLKRKLQFFGYTFSAEGVNPDPAKVQDIKNAPAPANVTEVRSFLGMINYCGYSSRTSRH